MVSWKDALVAYVSGGALFLMLLSAGLTGTVAWLVFVLPYGIPLAYVFWRDHFHLKEATLVSVVFGVTLLPLLLLAVWAFAGVLMLMGTLQPAGTGMSSLSGLLPVFLFNVAASTAVGLAVWFITHRAKHT